MPRAAICGPVRTALGNYGGDFRDVSAAELGAIAVRGLLERMPLARSRSTK
jgi:acetyl-CoA C-acetyltransferase